mmetsp:Transcript_49166/g.137722  ORF Transcript_49166/g.137722 Transcript_49166/m.137722 type:complete len:261 (+) Transcript_49166:1-783(+)
MQQQMEQQMQQQMQQMQEQLQGLQRHFELQQQQHAANHASPSRTSEPSQLDAARSGSTPSAGNMLLDLKMEICRNFAMGHCGNGDLCPFIHVTLPPSDSLSGVGGDANGVAPHRGTNVQHASAHGTRTQVPQCLAPSALCAVAESRLAEPPRQHDGNLRRLPLPKTVGTAAPRPAPQSSKDLQAERARLEEAHASLVTQAEAARAESLRAKTEAAQASGDEEVRKARSRAAKANQEHLDLAQACLAARARMLQAARGSVG